ncbi:MULTISPECIES: hypothetical protein [Streptomyces]|uniref:Uncharacterized protein n=2 Tax=Streptomyces TaxID=1883 RepID=A0ABV9J793_9ACTN
MSEPVDFHRVIVRAPNSVTAAGWQLVIPPADAFDPSLVGVVPVGEVRPGDMVIGTIQPYYDHLLRPLDRAQWVSYFSHAAKPQTGSARPFDPQHCNLCAHESYVRGIAAGSGHWTIDGCTTYRPGSLLLAIRGNRA